MNNEQPTYRDKLATEHYNNQSHAGRTPQQRADTKAEFRKDALAHYGITGHPKAGKAFDLAWDYGHANGFREVDAFLAELVQLVDMEANEVVKAAVTLRETYQRTTYRDPAEALEAVLQAVDRLEDKRRTSGD